MKHEILNRYTNACQYSVEFARQEAIQMAKEVTE